MIRLFFNFLNVHYVIFYHLIYTRNILLRESVYFYSSSFQIKFLYYLAGFVQINEYLCFFHILQENVAKRRNKLLTAMHMKKRYKYYCKQHDVTYLIESVRQKAKQLKKKTRNNLVQSFRALDVNAADSCYSTEDESNACALDENTAGTSKLNQVHNFGLLLISLLISICQT